MNESTSNSRKYLFTAVYGNYILQMFEMNGEYGYVIHFHHGTEFKKVDVRWEFWSVRNAISYGMIKMHTLNYEDGLRGFYSITFLD
jgi:hypothetical protein